MSTEIADFFAGKNVLITGATGFVGKVSLEKLLRICKDVGGIYIMIRTKDQENRLKYLLNFEISHLFKKFFSFII